MPKYITVFSGPLQLLVTIVKLMELVPLMRLILKVRGVPVFEWRLSAWYQLEKGKNGLTYSCQELIFNGHYVEIFLSFFF